MRAPRVLLAVAACLVSATSCGGPTAALREGDPHRQIEGMKALPGASDEDKSEAIPRLLALARSDSADVRQTALGTLDSLHFSDARPAWRAAVTGLATCAPAIAVLGARWDELLCAARGEDTGA
jgi:hypothetical protein